MLSEDDVKWDGDLPIVLVMNERDEYVCIEQGEGAEQRAVRWVGDNPDEQPVIFTIHDQRCPHCNRTFWHEAPNGSEETGWHCPLCDAQLTPSKTEAPNLIERLENLLAALDEAQEHCAASRDENAQAAYSRIEDAKGIAGEILTMIDGR